ncbi:MAG: nucleotidyltransferase domain-containing protein [Chloroflexota bacterium]
MTTSVSNDPPRTSADRPDTLMLMDTTTQRTKTTDEIIAEMVQRIVERFDPLQIILFGSRARGDARPDSDVDLLVVFPHLEDKRGTNVAILSALRHSGISKDVVVTTPDEIAAWGRMIGNVLEPALREGRILYERGAAA